MAIGECPNSTPECKYFPNCFSDVDHVVPRRLMNEAGATAMLGVYINHPVNKQQMCRREHDEKTHTEDPFAIAPPDLEMAQAVDNHPALISRTHRKIIDKVLRSHRNGTQTN